MESHLSPETMEILESIIDKSSLRRVVSALIEIAANKADHIVTNWQDRPLAGHWSRAAMYLGNVERNLIREGV